MNKNLADNVFATVDIIIEHPDGVIIIERKNKPFGPALVGGFINKNEFAYAAAIRESMEEVSVNVELTEQFYTYSGPKRDSRVSAVSVVFIAKTIENPVAADDAKEVSIASIDQLAAMANAGTFVFDHNEIIKDYLNFKKTGQRPGPLR
jgi:8-oxo-dGTP diphosphatase